MKVTNHRRTVAENIASKRRDAYDVLETPYVLVATVNAVVWGFSPTAPRDLRPSTPSPRDRSPRWRVGAASLAGSNPDVPIGTARSAVADVVRSHRSVLGADLAKRRFDATAVISPLERATDASFRALRRVRHSKSQRAVASGSPAGRDQLSRGHGVYCRYVPETAYAQCGDLSLAYQVVGQGATDVVFAGSFVSHVELIWTLPEAKDLVRPARRVLSHPDL